MRKLLAATCTASIIFAIIGTTPAQGTVPGENGRIAFRRYFDTDHTWGAIFTMNPDGSAVREITHPARGHLTTEPEWSPDGSWIAFWTGNEDTGRIWKIRADGSDRTYLSSTCTDACHADLGPSFSPDGTQIVFSRAIGCGEPRVGCLVSLYVMAADGTDVRQITQLGASTDKHNRFEDNWPQWLPDGSGFVFERRDNRQHDNRFFRHAIFTTPSDGSSVTRLTPWLLDAAQPYVSPDGQWILFRSHETVDHQNNLISCIQTGRTSTGSPTTWGVPMCGGRTPSPQTGR